MFKFIQVASEKLLFGFLILAKFRFTLKEVKRSIITPATLSSIFPLRNACHWMSQLTGMFQFLTKINNLNFPPGDRELVKRMAICQFRLSVAFYFILFIESILIFFDNKNLPRPYRDDHRPYSPHIYLHNFENYIWCANIEHWIIGETLFITSSTHCRCFLLQWKNMLFIDIEHLIFLNSVKVESFV